MNPTPEAKRIAEETLFGPLPDPNNDNAKLYLIRDRDIPKQSINNVILAFALALTTHAEEARREAYEDAAKIAENETKWFKEKDGNISLATSVLIASALRSKASGGKEEGILRAMTYEEAIKQLHEGWSQNEALRCREKELEKALVEMIGTHGEACAHYPCDALEKAKAVYNQSKKEK